MNSLTTAIYDRSQINSSFKTSIGLRFYLVKAPPTPTYPLVVYSLGMNKSTHYFGASSSPSNRMLDISCQFNIFSNNASSSAEAGTILDQLTDHFDFCNLTVSGYRPLVMKRRNILGPFWILEDNNWVYTILYDISLQKS